MLTQGREPVEDDSGDELNAAPHRHLDAIGRGIRIVADRDEDRGPEQAGCRPRVEDQAEVSLTQRAGETRIDGNRPRRGVERKAHRTIAMCSGRSPVYRNANRGGRSSRSLRSTSSRSRLWKRTCPAMSFW